jgi:hypothetical protein
MVEAEAEAEVLVCFKVAVQNLVDACRLEIFFFRFCSIFILIHPNSSPLLKIMLLNIILQIAKPINKYKSRT